MLENSLKFTKKGIIRIVLSVYGPYTAIEIHDNGSGIEEKK